MVMEKVIALRGFDLCFVYRGSHVLGWERRLLKLNFQDRAWRGRGRGRVGDVCWKGGSN